MIRNSLGACGLTFLLWGAALPASAGPDQDITELVEVLGFAETVSIMHEEGLRYGDELAGDMLPDSDAQNWRATVKRIYDIDKMMRVIRQDFSQALKGSDLTPMLAYFSGDDGREIVALELAARRAFLNPDTEAEAIDRFNALKRKDAALVAAVERIMEDSDLVDFNVMGTLNSSLMFYRGLSEGGAYAMSESEMLAEVWSTEEETRHNSREWLGAFLTLAYEPLAPEKLEAYADFYRTSAGRDLNRAIFAAFDRMYEEISYLMGLAVAQHMTSEPL